MYSPQYKIGDIVSIKSKEDRNLIMDILFIQRYPSDTLYYFLDLHSGRYAHWNAKSIDDYIKLVV